MIERFEYVKILHLLPNCNYIVSQNFINFVNENFGTRDHKFVFLNNEKNEPTIGNRHEIIGSRHENVVLLEEKEFIALVKKYDKVILHSLFISSRMKTRLLLSPFLTKKVVFVAWGGDIYEWESKGGILKSSIKKIIWLVAGKRIKHFVGIFPPDIDYFKKKFNSNAKTHYARYVNGLYNPLYAKELKITSLLEKIKNNDCINIQIGHSSSPILKHLESLENIAKFKNNNIKLYIPLNYGDKEYGDIVEKKALELFGNKVTCIRRIMDLESYMDHLSNIDIALFNTSRQIGLGTISPMLYMKKKIFIPKGSIMYEHYISLDVNICDYDEIEGMDYKEFTQPIDMDAGRKYVVEHTMNKAKEIEMWTRVFEFVVQ